MRNFEKLTLWQELDATNESYVRQKLACGGYSKSDTSLVNEWLMARALVRNEAREQSERRDRTRVSFMIGLGTLASILMAAVALVELLQHLPNQS